MILNITDRILFPQIMPTTGTFMEFNLKKSIFKKVTITDEDVKKYKIETHQETDSITWDREMDLKEPLEVNFTEEERAYLRKSCEQLSDVEKVDGVWILAEKIYDSK